MRFHHFSNFVFTLIIFEQHLISNASPLIGKSVEPAQINEFPFVVSLRDKNTVDPIDSHFCTGSLITRSHVLTARHCLDIGDLKNVQVAVGSIDLKSGKTYNVNSSTTYDEWLMKRNGIPEGDNDIAVLKLSKSVDDPKIVPVTLSRIKDHKLVYEDVTAAGWGVNLNNERKKYVTPQYLQKATLSVISREQCLRNAHKMSGNIYVMDPFKICTIASPKAVLTCGDSGGPLIYEKNIIVGINIGLCPPEKDNDLQAQNVHISVEHFADFIIDVTKKQCKPKA